MLKKSSLEQKIYLLLREQDIATFDIIKSWNLADPKVLKVALHKLVKKGFLFRIKKGYYLVQDPFSKGINIRDPFYLGQVIYNGYLGFSSALYIHRLIDEYPFTIYSVTTNKSATKIIGNYEFRAVNLGNRAIGQIKQNNYYLSSIPKTIYDCLYMPEYAGGYSKILKSIYNAKMRKEDWEVFLGYIKMFASHAFCQKTGYLLEVLKETGFNAPKSATNYLMERVNTTTLLGRGRKGTHNKKWRVTDNIGKENLLEWYG